MIAHIQHFAGAVWSPKTERGVMARLLSLPPIIGIACILAAVAALHAGWIGPGAAPLSGLARATMILVALGVFWSGACGLWYVLGVAWFLWATRQAKLQFRVEQTTDPTPYLLSCLWKLPIASAALCWLPIFTHVSVIPANIPRWALAIGMIASQLIITYLWIGVARGVLRWRHGI
ncbi:MAG: hypothetical protein WC617_12305 [Rhodanobacter sp.]|jgi:hypothetical protein